MVFLVQFLFYWFFGLISFLLWYLLARLLQRLLMSSGRYWASRSGFQSGWIAWFLAAAALTAFHKLVPRVVEMNLWPYGFPLGLEKLLCWSLVALRLPPQTPALRPFAVALAGAAVVQMGGAFGFSLGGGLTRGSAPVSEALGMAAATTLALVAMSKKEKSNK